MSKNDNYEDYRHSTSCDHIAIYSEVNKLEAPEFEPTEEALQMIQSSPNSSPAEKYLIREMSKLNQKVDWTMEALIEGNKYDIQWDQRLRSFETWRYDTERWKQDTNSKLKDIEEVSAQIKDAKTGFTFFKGIGTFIISLIASMASTLGAIYYIGEKLLQK